MPSYRGRGFYERALQLQAAYALRRMEHAEVHIDIASGSIASGKGIMSAGFKSKGIIDTCKLIIRRVKSWVWGYWDTDANHPGLDGEQAVEYGL